MPASLLLRFAAKGRFWLSVLLLHISVGQLPAAETTLVSGHVPAPVARGIVLPLNRMAWSNQLHLALSLPVRHAEELTQLLASIYNPASPEFHHYLTPKEFAGRFGPTSADYARVIDFANRNGLKVAATHANRLVVDVAGSAADVERVFHVKLQWYNHPTEARKFFAPDKEPTLDARLPLLRINGLDDFSRPHPNVLVTPARLGPHVSPNGGSSPYGTYMGNDFRQAYLPGTTLTGAGQSVDLVQFDSFRPEDITNYANAIGLTNLVPQVTAVPVNGGVGSPGANIVEVSLDIEMILAMAPGISNIFVYEAPNPSPWVDILSQIANDNLAAQVSCSWSGGGADPAAEQIFLQMAAQGQSFFNASGDAGMFTNLVPFPCASPNVTQVGGTYLQTDTNGNYVAEAVWNRGDGVASGGGVGLSVEMPVWQMGVDMTTNGGSTVWRNVPDVALTAEDVYVIADGQDGLAAGTSCAAPLWAGLMALINQQAAQAGQPPVGFMNPALYSLCRGTNYASIFHDITLGSNTNFVSATNYAAVPGFDLCTGWGTPAGTNLIYALTAPDTLGILPQNNFMTGGLVGGPFGQTNWLLTLTNSGAQGVKWSLGGGAPWLSVSLSGGSLCAHGTSRVNLQFVNPNALPAGGYRAVLMFTNQGLSRIQNVLVRLEIGQSIVQNGGFETGDFTGWTLVGDTVTTHYVCNIVASRSDYAGIVHAGNFGAFLGQSGYMATLSQTVPTIPGQTYLVSFWLDNLEAGDPQLFSAAWNGTNYVNLASPQAFDWTNIQFVAVADDTNATLTFGAENDPKYFGLDDVTVTPVPPLGFTSYWASTGGFQVAWPSLAGLNYDVQYTTNLAAGNWVDAGIITASTNLTTFMDTNAPAGSAQGFYRLVLLP